MRMPKHNHADSEESDEDAVYFAQNRDEKEREVKDKQQEKQHSNTSTPTMSQPISLKVSKDSSQQSYSYSPSAITATALVSSGGIAPTIIPANATPAPKSERAEKKKKSVNEEKERRDDCEREKEDDHRVDAKESNHSTPTPRDSSGKEAMAISLLEMAKLKEKKERGSGSPPVEGARETEGKDEAISPKHLGVTASKSSKQMKVNEVEDKEKVCSRYWKFIFLLFYFLLFYFFLLEYKFTSSLLCSG